MTVLLFKTPSARCGSLHVMDAFAAPALGVFFILAGLSHFLFPSYFHTLVPEWLSCRELLVTLSGAAEIVTGALLLLPARTLGAWIAVGLISGYLVSHVDAVRRAETGHPSVLLRPVGVMARLLVNLGYLGWAAAVALA